MSVPADATTMEVSAAGPSGRGWTAAVERLLVRAGDRLNPILVKEARQALKSRQFVLTFMLLLLLAWCWSILGVAMIGPEVSYGTHGPTMFAGYYVILAFPLLVIVPFGAYRSLAGEQEDRTYELLSITTLGPRQIIAGKLGSAILQMLIYLSAISPCLAFTYLLRGIDLPTILVLLSFVSLASLGLSVLGLFLGTLTAERHLQVILSVITIVGLLVAFWGACEMAFEIANSPENIPCQEAGFWQVVAAVLTAYATYFALVFHAAAARIAFESDNRATRLRIIMLVQYVLFAGWMSWLWVKWGYGEIVFIFMILVGLHWYVFGALMTGERPVLSHRVKRQLPQSFLGRAFFTWFNPGPGTGYVFAVSGLVAALALVFVAVVTRYSVGPLGAGYWLPDEAKSLLAFGVLGLSYVTFYLGLGLLVVRLLRRVAPVGILLAALIQVLLVLVGSVVPLVIQLMLPTMRDMDYSLLQVTNVFWTLAHIGDRSALPAEAPVLLILVPLMAGIVFLLNLPEIVRSVREVRIARPERVAEEEAARLHPPEPIRKSPWDEEES